MGSKRVKSRDLMKRVLRSADCVCFDVDSTIIQDEGIDELASYVGVGKEVAELTSNAMHGEVTFKESLAKRLEIMQPNQQEIAKFVRENPPELTKGAKDLVKLLHARGVHIYLISGGFRSLVVPVAEALNIPRANIYANRLQFYYNGEYCGFDETQPTSESGGKPKVIQKLKEDHDYTCVVHIGDGTTDLEAYPHADGFIGFGGNQVREKVQQEAPWFVTDFQELIDVLRQPSKSKRPRSES